MLFGDGQARGKALEGVEDFLAALGHEIEGGVDRRDRGGSGTVGVGQYPDGAQFIVYVGLDDRLFGEGEGGCGEECEQDGREH